MTRDPCSQALHPEWEPQELDFEDGPSGGLDGPRSLVCGLCGTCCLCGVCCVEYLAAFWASELPRMRP